MELLRAKELLKTLADGVNPLTGELLPTEDSCNQAEIVRALYTVVSYIDKHQKPQPENAWKPWTAEDEAALCRMFDAGRTRKDICEYFKRSSGAIAARLVHLGKITNRDEFRYK